MTDLERLELVLRRVHGRRERDHRDKGEVLNLDTQELLREIADEIALLPRSPA